MPSLPLFRAAAIVALILANGFFVAAEFAMVSLRRTRVQQLIEERRNSARIVADLQANLDELLPAVQLGVTLASLTLGWLGEPFVARFLVPWLSLLPHASFYGGLVSAILAFGLITYLEVIFGELVPKSLALRQGEKMALAIAGPIHVFIRVTRPLVRLMNASAEVVLRLFRLSRAPEGSVHSPEELKLITTATRRMGMLPEKQELIIHRVLDLDTITVREIMTPRQKIFSLPANLPIAEANARITQIQRSRIPVYDPARGPEHIIGVVYAKDMARLMHFRAIMQATPPDSSLRGGESELQIGQLMHDVLIVPETKAVSELLTEFQTRRRHLAIVVDEFGSITGLVTVEDALEQIVGPLEDEFDVRETSMQTLASGTLVLYGNVTLLDLESQMGWHLPHDGGVETLAGFLLVHMQKIPKVGDSFVHDGRKFTVAAMEDRRITRVRVEPVAVPVHDPQKMPDMQAQASLFEDRAASPDPSNVGEPYVEAESRDIASGGDRNDRKGSP
ncbi:MAG TPA: hemolysin family protein [Acidobacteriaceae bacterium]|nr:hemolysin family protein [Acidobacteriaceae bacterium]